MADKLKFLFQTRNKAKNPDPDIQTFSVSTKNRRKQYELGQCKMNR